MPGVLHPHRCDAVQKADASAGTAELHIRYFDTSSPWSWIIAETTMFPSECAIRLFHIRLALFLVLVIPNGIMQDLVSLDVVVVLNGVETT